MTDTDYANLVRRLRETHDNLNTIATPSGFKTPETHHAEFEQAMALCWKSADVIATLVKEIEHLKKKQRPTVSMMTSLQEPEI